MYSKAFLDTLKKYLNASSSSSSRGILEPEMSFSGQLSYTHHKSMRRHSMKTI